MFHVLRTVGIEVYFSLLVVQAGEVSDMITLLYDTQTFFGERYGIAEVLQADCVLYIIVIFGCNIGYQIFDGDTGIGFALSFQLFQFLVVGGDIEAVEDSPAQVNACIDGLVEHTVLFGCFTGGAQLCFGIIQSTFITGR